MCVDINVGIFLSSFYPGGSLVQTLTAALAQTEQEKLSVETCGVGSGRGGESPVTGRKLEQDQAPGGPSCPWKTGLSLILIQKLDWTRSIYKSLFKFIKRYVLSL